MGVILYTNIMGLMGDLLQEHARGPLFFLLSVLNLQPGVGVCVFSSRRLFSSLPSHSTSSLYSQSSLSLTSVATGFGYILVQASTVK